jgi:predicted nucleic acid-binding protein
MARVIVLDASALIALQDDSDSNHPWAQDLFRSTLDANFAMPAVTYAECLVHPIKIGRADIQDKNRESLGINLLATDEDRTRTIAEVRVSTNLRMPDAIVLSEALRFGHLATADAQLAKTARDAGLKVYSPA